MKVERILTDRGTEYCRRLDEHPYQLLFALHDITCSWINDSYGLRSGDHPAEHEPDNEQRRADSASFLSGCDHSLDALQADLDRP